MAGKLVTRCAEPYAEGDLVTVQLDMEQHHVAFLKNGVLQGAGDGLPGAIGFALVSLNEAASFSTVDLRQSRQMCHPPSLRPLPPSLPKMTSGRMRPWTTSWTRSRSTAAACS